MNVQEEINEEDLGDHRYEVVGSIIPEEFEVIQDIEGAYNFKLADKTFD